MNILPMSGPTAALRWAAIGALLATVACSDSEAPAEPQGGAGGGPSVEVPAPSGAEAGGDEAAAAPAFRIEPHLTEVPDVGLGELRTYRVRAHFEGEGPLPFVARTLTSSCSCLSARVVGDPDETGVDIEVTIDGMEPEDIDGVVELLGEDRVVLGEHVCRLNVASRLYVQPREVRVSAEDPEVRILVGCGFTNKATDRELVIDDFVYEESKLALEDLIPEEKVEIEYLLKTETFVLRVSDTVFEEAGETVFELRCALPSEKTFRIPIRWNARGDG